MTPPDPVPYPPLTGDFAEFDYFGTHALEACQMNSDGRDLAVYVEGEGWTDRYQGKHGAIYGWRGGCDGEHKAIRRGTEMHRANFSPASSGVEPLGRGSSDALGAGEPQPAGLPVLPDLLELTFQCLWKVCSRDRCAFADDNGYIVCGNKWSGYAYSLLQHLTGRLNIGAYADTIRRELGFSAGSPPARPDAAATSKDGSAALLRAMVLNYGDRHQWDHLDAKACANAAALIDAQAAEIADLKLERGRLKIVTLGLRAEITAARDEVERLKEALEAESHWHDSERDAMSKNPPRSDYQWRMLQHRERMDAIAEALTPNPAQGLKEEA